MTVLYASYQTNLDSYNLNYWYADPDFDEFRDDTNENGFEDSYFLYEGSDALALYGTAFEYWNTDMYFGTIQGLGQWVWVPDATDLVDGGDWVEGWHWTGWNVDMSLFFNTGDTPEIGDDFDIIRDVMSGADEVYLSEYDDSFRGFGGNDTMEGGGGFDTLAGNDGEDVLYGGLKGDFLDGGNDNDTLRGNEGVDTLYGEDGDDWLGGGVNSDEIYGGRGNDTLVGGTHADLMEGEAGADILDAGEGSDTLRGGTNKDELTGGRGTDTFVFVTGDGIDVIHDFNANNDAVKHHDTLDLSGLDAVTDWSDLSANHMVQVGTRVVISAGGDEIRLLNVDIGDLDAGDFVF